MCYPQWVMIVSLVIEFFLHIDRLSSMYKDGYMRNIMPSIIRVGGIVGILWWGGFWS